MAIQIITNYTATVVGVEVDASGITLKARYQPDNGTPPGPVVRYTLNPTDKSFRDPRGALLYADGTTFAPGILAAAVNLLAMCNTIHAQVVTDGKASPV